VVDVPSLGAFTPSVEVVSTHVFEARGVVSSLETVSVDMFGKVVFALDSVEASPTG
jgi:hypothetical protein